MKSRILLIVVAVCMFTGCLSWWESGARPNTPEALYARGQEAYRDKDYDEAIEHFQRLAEQYPLSQYAIPAELGVADSYFSDEDYVSAEANYSDFVEFHPTNENLPYVMHQIGLCHYKQIQGVDRDQTETRLAEQAFQKLIARFPSSKFSFLAEKELAECRKRLGEHEFYVGRFYFTRGEYRAALTRFQVIEKKYAGLGLDYMTGYFINETQKRLGADGQKNINQK
ncbi:MAG: outer membrane protein assembly factor BamD [Deltaproteobacteria bacterium]|nr:outer membrane protein assembly factor BamD [Deltaproteobacteria bacterium]